MTISTDVDTAGPYTGTGTVDTYSFAFKAFSTEEIEATVTDTDGALSTLTNGVDFTVSLNADQNVSPGGIITLTAGDLAVGFEIEIGSDIPATQGASFPNQGAFYPRVVENALDKLTRLIQKMGGGASNRNLRVPELSGVSALPSASSRAGKLLSFDPVTGAPECVAAADQSATQLAIDLASPAAVKGSKLVAFIQRMTGAVARWVEDKLAERVSVFDFMTVAQIADVQAGTAALDVTAAVQAAFTAALKVRIPAGTYKLTSQLTATVHHQITGEGFGKTLLSPTHTGFAIYIPPPVSDTQASLYLDQFAVLGKNGVQIGGTRASHPMDGAIIGGTIRVRCVGTYSNASGDAAYDTDKVRDAANALVSSNSGTLAAGAARKTFDDVEAYGVGIRLSKCIDTRLEAPQFYGNGVSVSLLGCDLIKWAGGRSHEVGLFFYSERIGTWGSQAELRAVDLLHNRRAGGILLNGTKFDRVTEVYYECYSNSALLLNAEQTEGVLIDDNRVDDPYYTGGGGTASGTTPIGLFVDPRWNNKIRATRFQKFSAFSVAIPPVRVTGSFASIDTNHPEAVAIEPASGYAPVRFKDTQIGCRYGILNLQLYTPNNIPLPMGGSGMAPLAVADGIKNVFYNAAALTLTARFDINQLRTAYTLSVNCKVVSGTTLFAAVEHHRYDGSLVATPFSGTFGGFVTTAYQFAQQAITLTQEPAEGDYLLVVWTSSSARVGAIEIK